MPNYRLFRLSPDNQIFGVSEVADFDSDRDVINHAKRKMDGYPSKYGRSALGDQT